MTSKQLALSTQDANFLVAEFMGYKRYEQTFIVIKGESIKLSLTYHYRWSELMPVIEYIDSLHERNNGVENVYCQTNMTSHTFYISFNSGSVINNKYPQYYHGRHRCNNETRIENVFWSIVDFIIWCKENNLSFEQMPM